MLGEDRGWWAVDGVSTLIRSPAFVNRKQPTPLYTSCLSRLIGLSHRGSLADESTSAVKKEVDPTRTMAAVFTRTPHHM